MESDLYTQLLTYASVFPPDVHDAVKKLAFREFLSRSENQFKMLALLGALAKKRGDLVVPKLRKYVKKIDGGSLIDDNTVIRGEAEDLSRAWDLENFHGGAASIFRSVLKASDDNFEPCKHYAKAIAIVQSSGVGKSRMVDQLSKEIPAIIYTLRKPLQTGYPPGDPEIVQFPLESTRLTSSGRGIEHAGSVALLSASISESLWYPFNLHVITMADSK